MPTNLVAFVNNDDYLKRTANTVTQLAHSLNGYRYNMVIVKSKFLISYLLLHEALQLTHPGSLALIPISCCS